MAGAGLLLLLFGFSADSGVFGLFTRDSGWASPAAGAGRGGEAAWAGRGLEVVTEPLEEEEGLVTSAMGWLWCRVGGSRSWGRCGLWPASREATWPGAAKEAWPGAAKEAGAGGEVEGCLLGWGGCWTLIMSVSSLLHALASSSRGLFSEGELVCKEREYKHKYKCKVCRISGPEVGQMVVRR